MTDRGVFLRVSRGRERWGEAGLMLGPPGRAAPAPLMAPFAAVAEEQGGRCGT